MKPKPIRNYARPRYPTRLEIAERPALLHRHQPALWRQWPELTGAAGLFLLADATRLPAADSAAKRGQTAAQTNAVAVVAPIFQQGEGRGATGCIVMSPPVFLSEEEAWQVIREEMAVKGVNLGTNQTALQGVTFSSWKRGVGSTQETLQAHAADPGKKVFVEFLSQREALRWDMERGREKGNYSFSTVQQYDMPRTAKYLADRVRRQATDRVYFGTLYDPMAGQLDFSKLASSSKSATLNIREAMGQLTVESKRLLRLQVRDFLEWLQAQGAI